MSAARSDLCRETNAAARKKLTILLLLLGVGVGWPVALHYRAKGRLYRYQAALKQAGEKLSIDELAPSAAPEAFNASLDLVSIARFLATGGPNGTNCPPVMKYAGPGKALVGWQQPVLPNSDTTNVWPGLRQEIEAKADALADVRGVLRNAPLLAFDLDYNQGVGLALAHLSTLKSISQWLELATVLELHEGRITNAFENLAVLVLWAVNRATSRF